MAFGKSSCVATLQLLVSEITSLLTLQSPDIMKKMAAKSDVGEQEMKIRGHLSITTVVLTSLTDSEILWFAKLLQHNIRIGLLIRQN